MNKEHYIQIVDDWYLGTDGVSFVLYKKSVVSDPKKAHAKSLGEERYEPMGYYATLGSVCSGLHRYLSMEVLARGGASSLEEYVKELSGIIDRATRLDESMVDKLREQMGVDK